MIRPHRTIPFTVTLPAPFIVSRLSSSLLSLVSFFLSGRE